MSDFDEEVAAAVLEPHFDAVRDSFIDFGLDKLKRTRLIIEPGVYDGDRHYARCRDDGLRVELAPEAAQLPWMQLVAIISHEFGHAADFAYPSQWVTPLKAGKAEWIGDRQDKVANRHRRLWNERTDDQVERAADSIAEAVTGMKIQYCGPCMLQCFSGGRARPAGLR